jgi:hypothetical protein
MIAHARSLKKSQVSHAEVAAAAARFRSDYKTGRVCAMLDDFEDHTGDVWFAEGDLHIPGDLDLTREGVWLLIVLGDLTVGGVYGDSDEPESFSLVTGHMRARDVVTAGWLEVHGDLSTDRLIGDYNDCGAHIGGDVHARLFYGEEHHFTVGGALGAGAVIGRPRLEIATPPDAIGLDDPRLLEHVDRDLLRVHEDHDEHGNAVIRLDGFRDFREIKRRVGEGLPLRAAAAGED